MDWSPKFPFCAKKKLLH